MEKPKQQFESVIRDWLSVNLNFIEQGLELIDKEYHLPDEIGAKGFVDLLCKDIYNNFVIVEIKRADASARQTINEVLKYYSLLKHNFKARESEIRIIILSTHWNELIRAFSEIYHQTDISLKGYKIALDSNTNIPQSIELIEPLSKSLLGRKFAFWQGLYFFWTKEKQQKFHEILNENLKVVPIEDYIIIDLDPPADNKRIIYKHSVVVAFQKLVPSELIAAIKAMNSLKSVMDRDEFDDDNTYQMHLEGAFIDSLETYEYNDESEAGYAEKFDGMINNQGWTVTEIKRYGIFKLDPRYNDELLLSEIRGHDGNNRNKFQGFAESTQTERIREIELSSMHCLTQTPQWQLFIEGLFEYLHTKKEKFRLLIDIYNPDSVMFALYFTLINGDPDYLPLYKIIIDYIELSKTEIYTGELLWNGNKPVSKLLTEPFTTEMSNEIYKRIIDSDNEIDAMRMGLSYTNRKVVIVENTESINEFVEIGDENEIISDNAEYRTMPEYIVNNKTHLEQMLYNFGQVYRQV